MFKLFFSFSIGQNSGEKQIWRPEADKIYQFMGPETDTLHQYLVQIVFFQELWPIEKEKNNLNMLWIMYNDSDSDS